MTRRTILVGVLACVSVYFAGCDLLFVEEPPPLLQCVAKGQTDTSIVDASCSSEADWREAQLLAVWLTGDLHPDPTLARRLCSDLRALRETYADTHPVVANRRFLAPWASRELTLKFEPAANAAIREGRYDGWQALPPNLRPDTLLDPPDDIGWSLVGFDEVYHMERLAKHYSQTLPDLLESTPNHIGFIGFATFPMLPLWNGRTLGLVFTGGYSRSPSYFFRVCNGNPEYVDRADPRDDPPRWSEKAWSAWEERRDS